MYANKCGYPRGDDDYDNNAVRGARFDDNGEERRLFVSAQTVVEEKRCLRPLKQSLRRGDNSMTQSAMSIAAHFDGVKAFLVKRFQSIFSFS